MKNILCVLVVLLTSVCYSQNNVSVKSAIPIEIIILKTNVSNSVVVQNKKIEMNDIVGKKQNSPINNAIIQYVGTPKSAYIEPILIQKRQKLF